MNSPSHFKVLLRNQWQLLNISGTPQVTGILILYALALGTLPLVLLLGNNNAQGNLAALFEANFLLLFAILFLICLSVWLAHATIPAFGNIGASSESSASTFVSSSAFEYLFTRAIDRRLLFRARSLAFYLVLVGPLFIATAVSPIAHDLLYLPSGEPQILDSYALSRNRDEQSPSHEVRFSVNYGNRVREYMKAFPNSYRTEVGQLAIRGGAVAYSTWITYSATLGFFALQAYGVFIGRRSRFRLWIAIFVRVFPLCLFVIFSFAFRRYINESLEGCFLFFIRHLIPMSFGLVALAIGIQLWCEDRFSKLEIPYPAHLP